VEAREGEELRLGLARDQSLELRRSTSCSMGVTQHWSSASAWRVTQRLSSASV
jgi:hypothetical protein